MLCTFMFRYAGALLSILLFTSCSSTPANPHGRFHEEAQADVILRFAGWNSIRITKPDTTEAGFMPVYNFEEAQKVLAKTAIGKNLAVVICGFAYKTDEEAKQQSTWSSVLGGLGYRRVT